MFDLIVIGLASMLQDYHSCIHISGTSSKMKLFELDHISCDWPLISFIVLEVVLVTK